METPRQGTHLFTAVCLLIGLLLVIQIWLVSASLDALLGGDTGVLTPAAIASLLLFCANFGLLWYVLDFDARTRARAGAEPRSRPPSAA